ncbi:hypothetical protein D3C81_1064840 [compost metagenome]
MADLSSSDSPIRDSVDTLQKEAEEYPQISKLVDLKIINLDQRMGEAVVQTTEEATRTGGIYTPDTRVNYVYTLVKEEGSWKIYDFRSQGVDYFVPKDALTKSISVPSGDETSLKQLIDTYIKSFNDKNLDGMLSTLDPSLATDDFKSEITSYFKEYEFKSTTPTVKIIYYTAEEAAVYVEENESIKADNETYQQTYKYVYVMGKSKSGSWLITDTYTLDQ